MCMTPCTGDSTQTCGGSGDWADVYMLGKRDCVNPGAVELKYFTENYNLKNMIVRKYYICCFSILKYFLLMILLYCCLVGVCFHGFFSYCSLPGLDTSKLYLGCYIDATNRDINDVKLVSSLMMTTVRCLAFCQGLGYTIAAIQVALKRVILLGFNIISSSFKLEGSVFFVSFLIIIEGYRYFLWTTDTNVLDF